MSQIRPAMPTAGAPAGKVAQSSPAPQVGASGGQELETLRNFANAFAKAIRSFNLYARNNETLQKFMQDAFRYASLAFQQGSDIDIGIHRETLTSGGENVLKDPDRMNGIPFRLFREGVRKLVLRKEISAEELAKLIEILARPQGDDEQYEDLVSSLWLAELPNVRYYTLDVYAVFGHEEEFDDQDAQEELKLELEQLLSAIYQGRGVGDKGVKALNVTSDDLVALATIGEDRERETERIGQPTERAIFNIDRAYLAAVWQEMDHDTNELLRDVTFDVLLGVLFRVRTAAESDQVVQEILNLYDSMVLAQDYQSAAGLVRRLERHQRPDDLRSVAIVQQLRKMFAAEQRLSQIAVAINDGFVASVKELTALFAALGHDVVPTLLGMLGDLQQPQHRRLLCDLILSLGPPPILLIRERFRSGEWFVDRDLLYLASKARDQIALQVVLSGCNHPHARVRHQAVVLLKDAPAGQADQQLIASLGDAESQVRVTAARGLLARRVTAALPRLRQLIENPKFLERENTEQRTMLLSYGGLAGDQAIGLFSSLLTARDTFGAGLLGRLRSRVEGLSAERIELCASVAVALASLGTVRAVEVLKEGAKHSNKRVREVCQRALLLLKKSKGIGPVAGGDA